MVFFVYQTEAEYLISEEDDKNSTNPEQLIFNPVNKNCIFR